MDNPGIPQTCSRPTGPVWSLQAEEHGQGGGSTEMDGPFSAQWRPQHLRCPTYAVEIKNKIKKAFF